MKSASRTGARFGFGRNWRRFLRVLDDDRIVAAENSLTSWIDPGTLARARFLDVGCGSGLFSLAARRLGARVHSFDYDAEAVSCADYLRSKYFPGDSHWTIERGSALDRTYLARLGQFDIVYSFGVLHHTGDMWTALRNMVPLVAPGGTLWIAVYNDQDRLSRRWLLVKRLYNRLPTFSRFLLVAPVVLRLWGPTMLRDLFGRRPFHTWRTYRGPRGMTPWVDILDWIGGYPFEVAKADELFDFYSRQGFVLERMRTAGRGHGNNIMLFRQCTDDPDESRLHAAGLSKAFADRPAQTNA